MQNMNAALQRYRDEMNLELHSILDYWMKHTIDETHGGFVGRIDHDNIVHSIAPKGSVLNSRILWTFSSAARLTRNEDYQFTAERAFHYIRDFFADKEHGGLYWTVDHKGQPLDTKKQVYALSFGIYGLSEYYRISHDKDALQLAVQLYHDIVKYSHDEVHGGYIEALSREWKEMNDIRLSEKDANERKSMNTHLHVMEGFVNLYRVWPDAVLKTRIEALIRIFLDHIISAETNHLILFFDDEWNSKSSTVSYGHDIEAAWLVQEAAEVIGDEDLLREVRTVSVLLADAAAEGLDKDGGLWYEYEPATNHLVKEKHSWPQAEAMVGFFNVWQLTGNKQYLDHSMNSWSFVQSFMHDKNCGEWYWGVYEDYAPMTKEDKVGIWKCPYHNSRACMEMIERISMILKSEKHEVE